MARQQPVSPAMDVVFLATPGCSARMDQETGVLRAQLRAQGISSASTTMIDDADPGTRRSRLAAALSGPGPAGGRPVAPLPAVALLDAGIVVNAPPLGAVLDDPRLGTAALSVVEAGRQLQLGVLKVDGADRAAAAALVLRLPSAAGEPCAPGESGTPADLLLQLTRALTAAGRPVQPVPLGGYRWGRRPGPADGPSEPVDVGAVDVGAVDVGAVDEHTVRLREAARSGDGFYSTFVLRRLSWRLTGIAERTGLTPNQVTLISFALGLLAAGFLAVGSRPWDVAGALLLQVCLVVDCVDGELARYRRRFSRFGAWLDATTDRVKEFAAVGGLALGGLVVGGMADLWWLAGAAIAVQTFRNLFDLGWGLQRSAAAPDPASAPAVDWVAAPDALQTPAARPAGPGARGWLRRIGHFPIGERFLLISLGAAFWTPRGTLTALLVAGLLSAGYQVAAFAVRGRSSSVSGRRIAALVDSGPVLGAALRRIGGERAGRLTVVLPALVAVAELGLIWVLATDVAGARRSAAVLLIAVTAIAHYQHAYGVREDGAPVQKLVCGTDARLFALLMVAVVCAMLGSRHDGGGWATAAVRGLAAVIAVSSTVRSLRAWTDVGGRSGHPRGTQRIADTQPAVVGNEPTALSQAIGGVR